MVAVVVVDVSDVAVGALDVFLEWTRLFRSILLGKYGSIFYPGVKDVGVKHEKRFALGSEHGDKRFGRPVENRCRVVLLLSSGREKTYGWGYGGAVC
jgi:hypothetical protein